MFSPINRKDSVAGKIRVPDEAILWNARLLDSLPGQSALLSDAVLRGSNLTLFNAERYHGPESWMTSGSGSSGFFEGWYFKLVSAAGRTVVAIPGVLHGEEESYGFVMLADPDCPDSDRRVTLHKYPISEFEAEATSKGGWGGWLLRIGPNKFSAHGLSLSIDNGEKSVSGRILLKDTVTWPATLLLPDIMGWFAWIPMMECRHGVVNLDAVPSGTLNIDGESVNMDGGRAYVEKDWGSKFPKTWVWIQANHFETEGGTMATLMLSVASIPFPSDQLELLRFRGFLGCLNLPGQGLFRFATYTGATIDKLEVSPSQSAVELRISSAQHRLFITAHANREEAVLLHGPVAGGKFPAFVNEMLGATVHVRLERRSDGAVLFKGRSGHGGLEIESVEEGGIRLLTTHQQA